MSTRTEIEYENSIEVKEDMRKFIYKGYIVREVSTGGGGWIAINQDCKTLITHDAMDCNCNVPRKIKDEVKTLYKLSQI